MKGRAGGSRGGNGNGGVPTDLLVCFPPCSSKPTCSSCRPTDAGRRHRPRPRRLHFKAKTQDTSSEIDDEPTSPKVTCFGQIKVRTTESRPRSQPRHGAGGDDESWASEGEEFEGFHRQRKRPHWLSGVGLKNDIVHFVGALRRIRFNMRCFGSYHRSVHCTTNVDDGDEDREEKGKEMETSTASKTMLSRWFMLLEEIRGVGCNKRAAAEEEEATEEEEEDLSGVTPPSSVPPPNALLLMRCRSTPAQGWFKVGEKERDGGDGMEAGGKMIIEEVKEKERLVQISYASHYFKISMDIAPDVRVAGSMERSRSWRR